jgi:hypothetical protein
VARAAPDGYTLLNGNNAILATNAALYKKINSGCVCATCAQESTLIAVECEKCVDFWPF